MQVEKGMEAGEFAEAKGELVGRLKDLEADLNRHLADEYGVGAGQPDGYGKWLASHQPFHWFIEFYGILKSGGFDVVIGNPPYVEYSKIRSHYRLKGFTTESCGNAYAFCVERSYTLLKSAGRFGFIVQAPIVSTERMTPIRKHLQHRSDNLFYATFDDRPSKLFEGMDHCRVAIVISKVKAAREDCSIASTRYHKWYREERPHLFATVQYSVLPETAEGGFIPKFRSPLEAAAFGKVTKLPRRIGELESPSPTEHSIYYKITGVGHWFTFTTASPRFWREGVEGASTRQSSVAFETQAHRDTAFCCLWSTLHYWIYQMRTNCRDFNPSDFRFLPIPAFSAEDCRKLTGLASRLSTCLEATSETGDGNYAVGGSVTYQKFRPRFAKPIIDEIDRVLAKHYGFTDEELDFIINYDIKYRMGLTGENDDNE